jgi:predicted alpha-1,2-mannosidase
MMRSFRFLVLLVVLLALACSLVPGQVSKGPAPTRVKKPIDYANGLVGTAPLDDQKLIGNAPPPGEELYTGFTSPGARLPHGSTNLSPINKNLDLAYPAGVGAPYTYPRRTMLGFSSPMSGLTVMPVVGDWTVPPERSYSVYSKPSEKATPGYYTVYFPDHKITIELTAATRSGLYRFTFPRSERSVVLLDMGRAGGNLEIAGDHTVRGCAERGGRGATAGASPRGTARTCFIAEFSKPFTSFGTFHQNPPQVSAGSRPASAQASTPGAQAQQQTSTVFRGNPLGSSSVTPDSRAESGSYAGAYLNFSTTAGEQVLIKVSSGDSYEAAQKNLDTESPRWDFDGVKKQAEAAWAKKLNQIEVKGGTEKERTLFYSTLLHSFASPRLVARKGESFTGQDGQQRVAEYDRYGPVPYWDTGRDQVVLLTLLEPDAKVNILRSQLDMARETGWMGTSFHGDHAVLMYLGDWQRGLNFNEWEATYEYLRKNATAVPGRRPNLAEYLEKGYVSDIVVDHPSPPYAGGNAGVAKTLEYSWDDFALATYAQKLDKDDDYKMFLKRAGNYKNVFDASVGFMRGRKADGSWIAPFDPREPYYNFMMKEASGWGTLWLVPHDVQGLIDLLGGREKFVQKLDEFFTTPYNPKGICRDCTGMIGQYVQGNQPDQQTAYYYDYAGAPWKTQEVTRKILRLLYGSDQYGLAFPGMDDQGSTSSWYVLSAMGFFTVDPSRPEYLIGSPIFDEVTIHMGNGKDFVIVANNNSEKNIYIQSATLNGKPLDKPWFSHADIANGGKLVFNLGPAPNKNWGAAPGTAPPSMSH